MILYHKCRPILSKSIGVFEDGGGVNALIYRSLFKCLCGLSES